MNKRDRGLQGDATYQISKFVFFVPMLQLVTPKQGPLFSQGSSYEPTW